MSDQIPNEPIPIEFHDNDSLFGRAVNKVERRRLAEEEKYFRNKIEKVAELKGLSPSRKDWQKTVNQFKEFEKAGRFSIWFTSKANPFYGVSEVTNADGSFLGDIVTVGLPEGISEFGNEITIQSYADLVQGVLDLCMEAELTFPNYLKWKGEFSRGVKKKLLPGAKTLPRFREVTKSD